MIGSIIFSPLISFLFIFSLLLVFILIKKPSVGFLIILSSLLAGQFLRLPLSVGGGVLFSDIFILLVLLVWFFKKLSTKKKFKKGSISLTFFSFSIFSFISLVLGMRFLDSFLEFLLSFFYLFRFIEYGLLYFLVLDIIKSKKEKVFYIKTLIRIGLFLAIFGFIQLVIYPNFGEMAKLGWDPHIGRLLSTWFDPNFCAGLFAFLTLICFGILSKTKNKADMLKLIISILIFSLALFFTYSRSGYLSLIIPLFLFGTFKMRKLLIIGFISCLLVWSLSERTQQRVGELYRTIISLSVNSAESVDPTASHRIRSWLGAWEIIKDNPVTGIGFNTFRFYSIKEGINSDVKTHSSGGSDSSILNIIIMTGFLGFFFYSLLVIEIFLTTAKIANNKKATNLDQGLAIGFFYGFLSILLHSFFVNSLLFPFIMIFIWSFFALTEITPKLKPEKHH